jgi:twitching motility protein PilJ
MNRMKKFLGIGSLSAQQDNPPSTFIDSYASGLQNTSMPPATSSRFPASGHTNVSASSSEQDNVSVFLLGSRSAAKQQRILAGILTLSLLVLIAVTWSALQQTNKAGQQIDATGKALMQSQRLAKSVSQSMLGTEAAFIEVKNSSS